jgi:hypothetical protein
LRQIAELQSAGHSLDAIRRILDGKPVARAAPKSSDNGVRPPKPRPALSAELWTRLCLMDGVELSFDSTKHRPDVQALLALRDAVRDVFQRREED